MNNNDVISQIKEKKSQLQFITTTFFNLTISITIFSISTYIIQNHLPDGDTFWLSTEKVYDEELSLHKRSFLDNQQYNKENNLLARINTKNYLGSKYYEQISVIKENLLSDIQYYKDKGFYPIEPLYEILLIPHDNDTFLEKNPSKKLLNDTLSVVYEKATLDRTIDFSSSTSKMIPKLNINVKNTPFGDFNESLDVLNCKITVTQYDDQSFLFTDGFIREQGIYDSEEFKHLKNKKYTPKELKLMQEFVFLHEYTHCLNENKFFQKNINTKLFGYSDVPEVADLSSYLFTNSFYSLNYLNIWGKLDSNLTNRYFEKSSDTISSVIILNRYLNNNPDKETLVALNSLFKEIFTIRLISHLNNPRESHGGFEIFNYLSKPKHLEEIANLKSFDEIINYSFDILEKSQSYRTAVASNLYTQDLSFIVLLRGFDKVMSHIFISEKNNFDVIPNNFLKEHQLLLSNNENSISHDFFDNTIDYYNEKWKIKENINKDFAGYNGLLNKHKSKDNLTNIYSNFLSQISPNNNYNLEDFYYYLKQNQSKIESSLNPDDLLDKTLLKLFRTHLAFLEKENNYFHFVDSINKDEIQAYVKDFGKFPIDVNIASKISDFSINYNPETTILYLQNNILKQYVAQNHNIKRYSLETPTDETIDDINKILSSTKYTWDYENIPFIILDKKFDTKIENILNNKKAQQESVEPKTKRNKL